MRRSFNPAWLCLALQCLVCVAHAAGPQSCINTIAGVTSSVREGLTAMGIVYAVTSDCHGGRPLALSRTGIFQAPVRWGDMPVALVRFDAPLGIPFTRPQGLQERSSRPRRR